MDYFISVLSRIGIEAFVALSAYLLLIMGRVSFGQQAFFALGAYAAGIATTLWGIPFWLGLAVGAAGATAAAIGFGLPMARTSGLAFSMGSLAFAELIRIGLLAFHYRVPVGGELVGPDGAQGFRGIRLLFASGITPAGYLAGIVLLLGLTVAGLVLLERSRLGAFFRMVGEDETAAASLGVRVVRVKTLGIALAGALAGTGGGLFVHLTTYVEPGHSDVMLGVHGLAYGLIGGLGTPLGPLLGVALDIGFLEAFRLLRGYRMIVFGGLVAAFLIVRPRGLLDERTVHRIRNAWKR